MSEIAEILLILATAFTEGSTSNYRMQQLLGKNSLEVGKTLYSLVGNGMLIPGNKGRWTYYSLNSEYMGNEKSRSKDARQEKAGNNTKIDELLSRTSHATGDFGLFGIFR